MNTDKDFEVYDSVTKERRYVDSQATCTWDAKTGVYDFKWREPGGKWFRAEWTPPSQLSLAVTASVAKVPNAQGFRYVYSASNSAESRQACDLLRIESEGEFSVVATPEKCRLFSARSQHGRYRASWTGETGGEFITPGSSCCGFVIESTALPSVANFWILGKSPCLWSDGEPPSSIERALDPLRGQYDDEVVGLTVGPGRNSTSLELILSYLPVCFEQGWLSSGRSLNAIQEGLSDLLAASNGPPGVTVKKMDDFLQTFEVWSKDERYRITDEAYALIRYNCEWLRDEYAKQAQATKTAPAPTTPPTTVAPAAPVPATPQPGGK